MTYGFIGFGMLILFITYILWTENRIQKVCHTSKCTNEECDGIVIYKSGEAYLSKDYFKKHNTDCPKCGWLHQWILKGDLNNLCIEITNK